MKRTAGLSYIGLAVFCAQGIAFRAQGIRFRAQEGCFRAQQITKQTKIPIKTLTHTSLRSHTSG